MTISERNNTFKGEFILSLVFVILGIPALIVMLSQDSSVLTQLINGSSDYGLSKIPSNFYLAYASIMSAIVYASAGIIFIYFYFEKTQSPEIFFFSLFILSFSFELLRVIIPFSLMYEWPTFFIIIFFKILLFIRYFGLLSLFIASIYASGFDLPEQKTPLLINALLVMTMVIRIPVDVSAWDTSFDLQIGLQKTFSTIEGGCALLTLLGFVVASYIHDDRNFLFVGLGSILVFVGRYLLLYARQWGIYIAGITLLIVGSGLICIKLHTVYLWR